MRKRWFGIVSSPHISYNDDSMWKYNLPLVNESSLSLIYTVTVMSLAPNVVPITTSFVTLTEIQILCFTDSLELSSHSIHLHYFHTTYLHLHI